MKHRLFSVEAMLPFVETYLSEWISYDSTVWSKDTAPSPSTLWHWLHAIVGYSSRMLAKLQRSLTEAGVALMQFAKPADKCVNAVKAKRLDMKAGLNRVYRIAQIAHQFLDASIPRRVMMPTDMFQRYPPQRLQDAIF